MPQGKVGARADRDIRDAIVELASSELTAPQILEQLAESQRFKGRTLPGLRNIQRITKVVKEHVDILDEPFAWHRLGEYGLPWEAGELLLKIWLHVTPGNKSVTTGRAAVWWWRVHLADREAPVSWVAAWGQTFAQQEWGYVVFGDSLSNMNDLWAHMAYGHWRGGDRLAQYRQAVKEGLIPPLTVSLYLLMEDMLIEQEVPLSLPPDMRLSQP